MSARDESAEFAKFLVSCFPNLDETVIVEQLQAHPNDHDAAVAMIMALATEFEGADEAEPDLYSTTTTTGGSLSSIGDDLPTDGEPPPSIDEDTKLQLLVDMFPDREWADLERVLHENNMDVDEAVDVLTGAQQLVSLLPQHTPSFLFC